MQSPCPLYPRKRTFEPRRNSFATEYNVTMSQAAQFYSSLPFFLLVSVLVYFGLRESAPTALVYRSLLEGR